MATRARTVMLVAGVTAWAGAGCKDFLNPFENACTPATAVYVMVESDSMMVGQNEVMVASAASDPGFLDFPLCPFVWRTSNSAVVALSDTTGKYVFGLARSPGTATVTVINEGKSASVALVVR